MHIVTIFGIIPVDWGCQYREPLQKENNMKDQKACQSGDDCQTGCQSGHKADWCVRDMWKERGGKLAGSAIHEIAKEKAARDMEEPEIKFDEELETMVDAFIDQCERSCSDPLEVVEHIARREGIKVSDDGTDDGTEKDKLRKFLIAVVRRIVIAFLFHVADMYGMGAGPLLELILGIKKDAAARGVKRTAVAPGMSFRTFRVFFC